MKDDTYDIKEFWLGLWRALFKRKKVDDPKVGNSLDDDF